VKIVIDGREYTAVNHRMSTPLHLMELQQQSRPLIEGGLGMQRLDRMAREQLLYQRAMKAHQKQAAAGAADIEDAPLAPDDALVAIAVVLFLTRRAAGEQVTFAQAADQPLESVQWIPEPGDDGDVTGQEAPDPTPPGPGTPETPEPAAGPAASV
jgi:hypothetical protein